PPRKVRERGRVRGRDPPAEILRGVDGRPPVVRSDLETPESAEETPRLGGRRAAREENRSRHRGARAPDHQLTCSRSGTRPGASGRAGGSATARGRDQRRDTRSTTTNSTGTRKIATPVEKIMPVMVTVPISRRAMAPAPSAFQSGSRPKM